MSLLEEVRVSSLVTRTLFIKPEEPRGKYLIPDENEKGVFIGKTLIGKKPVFWMPHRLVNTHITLIGGTGFGKSTAMKTILYRSYHVYNTNCIILDFAGEYVKYAQALGGIVIDLGKDAINILDLCGQHPAIRVQQALTALEPFLEMKKATRQARILRMLMLEAYRMKGIELNDPDTWTKEPPTLKDVLHLLEKTMAIMRMVKNGQAELEDLVDSEYMKKSVELMLDSSSLVESTIGLMEKLEVYTSPPNDVFARHSTVEIEKLFESGFVVINLHSLGDQKLMSTIALTILQTLAQWMIRQPIIEGEQAIKKPIRLIVVLDEAWKVLEVEGTPVRTLVKEGRKFGISVVIASQEATELPNYVTNNPALIILLKVKSNDRDHVIRTMNIKKHHAESLESFGVGEALVFMDMKGAKGSKSGKVEPFMIYIYPVQLEETITVMVKSGISVIEKIMKKALNRYKEAVAKVI